MLIGILSDTHDNLPMVEKAVRAFNAAPAGFVIHAGDFVAPFVIDRLAKLSCDWAGVFGNNDGEKRGLLAGSAGRIHPAPFRFTLDGKKVTVVHDIASIDTKKEKADIIVYGHSHSPDISHEGGSLLVNPGECSGWLSGKPTIAFVDSAMMTARIVPLQ